MSYNDKTNSQNPDLEEKYETENEQKLEPYRVQKVVDALRVVKENVKNGELSKEASQTLESLESGSDPRKFVKIKKYVCKRCSEEFNDKREAQGHYNGDTMCDGNPRWTSSYNSFDEQFEIKLGP